LSTDPAIMIEDAAFIDFASACEKLVAASSELLSTRDAIATLAAKLASGWHMPHADFRKLQPGAPYSSYQLYLNDQENLSIILDIFAPGQVAPIHNHCCWGVFVCLEGEEMERRYAVAEDLSTAPVETQSFRNGQGMVSVGDPARNAFHQVECLGDVPAISLHIYGANLKAMDRERWDADSGQFVTFRSGSDPRRQQASHYLTPAGLRATTA
jgi:predicted metal-dependent enzyme (double-stranded beta helix superfamily)